MALQVRNHIAAAPFNKERRALKEWARLAFPAYVGRRHPVSGASMAADTELDSAEWHAVKHCARGEWGEGTTLQEYLDDMRRALRHPAAWLYAGRDHQRTVRSRAVSWVDTTMPDAVKYAEISAGRIIFTMYDVERQLIVSCYVRDALDADTLFASWKPVRRLLP
jgi:hypothetical protein